MARGRMLSRDVSHDLELNEASLHAALLFTWAIPHLDRAGRMPGHPKQVLATAVPMSPHFDEERVRVCLGELHLAGLITWYRGEGDGRLYVSFPGFSKHQRIREDREAPSKIPPPEDGVPVEVTEGQTDMFSGVAPGGLREVSEVPPAESKVREGKGREGKGTLMGDRRNGGRPPDGEHPPIGDLERTSGGQYIYPHRFERAWEVYPDRSGGNSKKAAYKAWRARVRNGADPEEMYAGTVRYRRFCDAEGRTGTRHVKMAKTFWGPDDWWDEPWEPESGGEGANSKLAAERERLEGVEL